MNNFVVGLLQRLHVPEHNLVVSPFGILSNLVMVLPGSDGATRDQLLQTLFGRSSLEPLEAANECLHQFASSLAQILERNHETLSVANLMYLKQDVTVNDQYVATLLEHLKVQVKSFDFANKSTAEEEIAKDIKKATRDKIENVQIEIDRFDCLILVSAIYFNDLWVKPFDKGDTKIDGEFRQDNGQVAKTAMMYRQASRPFYLDNEANTKALCLEYQSSKDGGIISMILVLPAPGIMMDSYIRSFTGEQLYDIMRNLSVCGESDVKLKMPRFKIHGEHSLKSSLASLGVVNAFDRMKASLPFIAPVPLHISQAHQSALIDVDEKGTVATAYTSSRGKTMAGKSRAKVIEFFADRPFIYALVANSYPKQVLFIGVVAKFPV